MKRNEIIFLKDTDALGDVLPLVQNIFKLLESIGFNINDTTSSRSWFVMNLHISSYLQPEKHPKKRSCIFSKGSVSTNLHSVGAVLTCPMYAGSARVGP